MEPTPQSTKQVKVKNIDTSLEELNAELPDSSFLAVFGTSHSAGCCERGDSTHISEQSTWHNLLANKWGMQSVNFALPGNSNLRMQQQVLDFMDMDRSRYANCLIAEVRLMDGAYSIGRDVLREGLNPGNANPEIARSFNFMTFFETAFETVVLQKYKDRKYLADIISQQHQQTETEVYEAKDFEIDILESIGKTKVLTDFSSCERYIEDLISIRTIQTLCKQRNIDFYWFCWDFKTLGVEDHITKKVDEHFKKHTNIFDAHILPSNIRHWAISKMGKLKANAFFEANECECHHHNEKIHAWVAHQINKEVKNGRD